MKSVLLAIIAVLTIATGAFAFGPLSRDSQQVKGDFVLSNPARSTCTDIPVGRAGQVVVTVPSNTLLLSWQTFVKSTGVAVAVKRFFNSNTAYKVSSGQVDAIHPNTATVKLVNYSTATVHTVCYDTNN